MLLNFIDKIEDTRRSQGRQYQLRYILLFSVFAVICGANSYKTISKFIEVHFFKLDEIFNMGWVRAPHQCTIRYIFHSIDSLKLEQCFRDYTEVLIDDNFKDFKRQICVDGKRLRGSFDSMADQKASHILSIFAQDCQLIIAHHETDDKSNEIPALQDFIKEVGLSGFFYTMDAMHCQKKLLRH